MCPDEIIVLITWKEAENEYQEASNKFCIISLCFISDSHKDLLTIMSIFQMRVLKLRNDKELAHGSKDRVEQKFRPKSFFNYTKVE